MRDSTIKDFTAYTGMKVPSSPADVELPNGSIIMFRHGNVNDLAALRNLNLAWVGIEQGEEYDDAEVFNWLRERIRRGTAPYRQLCVIANSNGRNWLWEMFVERATIFEDRSKKVQVHDQWFSTDEHYYSHSDEFLGQEIKYELWTANSFVNAHNLPIDTVADWLSMEKNAPNHFRRMIMNSFDEVDDSDLVFNSQDIQLALNQEFLFNKDLFHKKIMAVDIAEQGKDSSVAVLIEQRGPMHWEETEVDKWQGYELMNSVGRIMAIRQQWNPDILVIDGDGMGTGVYSRIKENGIDVVKYRAGRFPDAMKEPARFLNKTTEDAFYMKEKLIEGFRLKILPAVVPEMQTIRYTYDSAGGKIRLIPKSKMPKSPDHYDALKMACSVVDTLKVGEFRQRRRQPKYAKAPSMSSFVR